MMKNIPLSKRFLFALVMYTLSILGLWFSYHSITHRAMSRSERENTILAVDNLTAQIGAEFKQMNMIASVIAGSDYVQDFLGEQDKLTFYEKAGTVSEIVRKIAFPISSADSVLTISESGRYYKFTGGLSNASCEKLYTTFRGKDMIYTVMELDDTLFFCHMVPVVDYSEQLPIRLGNVIILTGLDKTRRTLEYGVDMPDMDVALILDDQVILCNKPSLEGSLAFNMDSRYGVVSTAIVDGTPLVVMGAIQNGAWVSQNTAFFIAAIISLCLLLSMIYVLYRHLSKGIIGPMSNIIAHVREIGGGQKVRLPETGISDFDTLVAGINEMLGRMEDYNTALVDERQKLFEAEIHKQKMRMGLLSTQMNAHFIVNTLTNIKRLSDKGENEKASQMAAGLAAILKHHHTGDELVNVFNTGYALTAYCRKCPVSWTAKQGKRSTACYKGRI